MKRLGTFILAMASGVAWAAGNSQTDGGQSRPTVAANLFRAQSWLPPPPPEPPPPPPQAPPLPFAYLGQLQEEKGIALFLGRQQTTLIVRKGDIIDDTYRVEDVTPMSATFMFLPLGEKQQLFLRTQP